MEKQIIWSGKYPNIRLRSIGRDDLGNLRAWKNNNRKSFFFQGYITCAMQEKWHEDYLMLNNGYMFIVEEYKDTHSHPIGCMGYRFCKDGGIDLYNIIRGERSEINQKMSSAMKILISSVSRIKKDITCKVLKSNPALQWYCRIGFNIKKQCKEFVLLTPGDDLLNADLDIQVTKGYGN